MPQVPVPPGRQVKEQGYGNLQMNVTADAESFGGGASAEKVTNALTKTAQTGMELGFQWKKEADTSAFTQADSQTKNLKNDLFWNKDTGAWKAKGEQAFTVTDDTLSKFDQESSAIYDNLANDDQKRAYAKARDDHRLELTGMLERHSADETTKYQNAITESGIKSTTDDAIYNYHDPGKISGSIDKQSDLIKEWATRQGLPEDSDVVKEKIVEARSRTYTGVVNRMLANGEDQLASHYYKEIKDELHGDDIVHLEKSLEEGSVRGESQRKADAIMSKYTSPADQLEAIRAEKDPKIRDAVRDRVVQAQGDKERASNLTEQKMFADGINILEHSHGQMDVTPSQFEIMSPSQKVAYKEYKKKLISGEETATDLQVYYSLQRLPPGKFREVNLLEYVNKLSRADFEKLTDAQKNEKILDGYRADHEVVDSVLVKAGMSVKHDDDESNNLRRKIEEQQMAYQDRTGKKATNKEIQDFATKMATEKILNKGSLFEFISGGRLFDEKKKTYEIQYKDVPQSEKQQIIRALQKRRIPVTEDRVLNLYTQGLENAD